MCAACLFPYNTNTAPLSSSSHYSVIRYSPSPFPLTPSFLFLTLRGSFFPRLSSSVPLSGSCLGSDSWTPAGAGGMQQLSYTTLINNTWQKYERELEPERGREIESFLWQENRVWLTVKCWPSQEGHVQNKESYYQSWGENRTSGRFFVFFCLFFKSSASSQRKLFNKPLSCKFEENGSLSTRTALSEWLRRNSVKEGSVIFSAIRMWELGTMLIVLLKQMTRSGKKLYTHFYNHAR